jgi:hypothetical protein
MAASSPESFKKQYPSSIGSIDFQTGQFGSRQRQLNDW